MGAIGRVLLGQVDSYRSSRYFFVEMLERTLGEFESVESVAKMSVLRRAISDHVGVRQVVPKVDGTHGVLPKYFVHQPIVKSSFRIDQVHQRLLNSLFRSASPLGDKWRDMFDRVTDGQYFSYSQIADFCHCSAYLGTCLITAVEELRQEVAEHKARLKNAVLSADFMGI